MHKHSKAAALVVTAASLIAIGGAASATASSLIGSHDIRDGAVHRVDLSKGVNARLDRIAAPGAQGEQGLPGTNGHDGKDGVDGTNGRDGVDGKDGKDGANGLTGAYYSVAFYDVGDTNQGAIATVACKDTSDTAISGGVQSLALGGHPAAVASSFVGRMAWATNTVKPNRTDGWIVQFDANQAPEKVKVYALCVPNVTIPLVDTYTQSAS